MRPHVDLTEPRRAAGDIQPRRREHVLDESLELGQVALDVAQPRVSGRRRAEAAPAPSRMRASGERSSWETLASSSFWPRTSRSTRSAISLNARVSSTISSLADVAAPPPAA